MGELPRGWAPAVLGIITEINPKLPDVEIDDAKEVTFLPMKLVAEVSNKVDLSETRKYIEVKKGFTPMFNGDVIFAKITPCMENGKIAVVNSLKNSIAFGSTEFHVFRCKEVILNQYLFYYLVNAQFRQDAQYHMTGAVGQKRVPKKYLEDYIINLPPLPEQHRIVNKIEKLFSSLDKGIEGLKNAQAQLKIYRQAVLKWAFEGKLTNVEMSNVKIIDHSELVTKGASPKWQGFDYIDDSSQLLFVTSENVREGFIDVSQPKYLSIEFNGKQKRSILKKGDILFNIVGASIGRAAIFYFDSMANINQAVAVIRLTQKVFNKYLSYYLNSEVAKQAYLKKTVDVARANLSLADVNNIIFPLPLAIKEQQNIVAEIESRLSVCDKLEESINQSLQQAEALRQSILKKAFEGKLVPQDLNDEPASVLLERIRAERATTVAKNATVRTRGRPARKQS